MNVKLITIGKTSVSFLIEGEAEYQKRLKHYMRFERIDLNDLKTSQKTSQKEIRKKEGDLLLSKLTPNDIVVLLDEKGTQMNSIQLAKWFEKKTISGARNVVFVIGGAFGFDNAVYDRANEKISLSNLTFSHQMVRLFFLEQLYRISSILKGEKYHHQ
ncbi:MAG: 23S rRNA (pseudouridine(1915)-N(3))-methyltransferase RlmH [Crocinitomicaceae bacterium]|jgi:23S rRNA (pseudouridine1915-N3)-methyltransferase|tara:strand:- start:308 stop:781 length:474 start_codon:yes stop_codon:yes gene_type:complete